MRDADLHKERFWLIQSDSQTNRTGKVRKITRGGRQVDRRGVSLTVVMMCGDDVGS